MAKGIIGEPFTFTVLFLNPNGEKFQPDVISIEVFHFDSTGAKQVLAAAGTPMIPVATELGRYSYTITIPSTLTPADQIYGVMTGEITTTGEKIVAEEVVDPFEQGSGGALEIQDEGVSLGTFSIINFVGAEVEVKDVGGVATVYIPPLPPPPPSSFQSHWNSSDGDNGNQSVSDGVSRTITRISTPNGGEGTPFKTGGWAGLNRSTTRDTSTTMTTPSTTTGWGGDSYFVVTVFDADGTTVLDSYTSPSIASNFTNTTGSITSEITSYAVDAGNGIDPDRNKAKLSVEVDLSTLLPNGGKYNCQVVMYTDSATDGTGPYTFTQNAVFIDANPTDPFISGTVTFAENPGVVVKFLSGVRYYTIGSSFTVGVTGIDNLNGNTIKTSNNLTVTPTGYLLPTLNLEPFNDAGFAGWTNNDNNLGASYLNSNWSITQGNRRYTSTNARAAAVARDPWKVSAEVQTGATNIIVDTFGISSNEDSEYFNDENLRQTSTYNAGNPAGNWVSSGILSNGELMVFGGKLQIAGSIATPNLSIYEPLPNPNYISLTASGSYYRTFVDTTGIEQTAFTINLSGDFVVNAVTDLLNEDLKIFIRRRSSSSPTANTGTTAPPLKVHGPLYDFSNFNDAATDLGSRIRLSSSSGGTIRCTFGGALYNCIGGAFVEIEIANPDIKLTSFIYTFG